MVNSSKKPNLRTHLQVLRGPPNVLLVTRIFVAIVLHRLISDLRWRLVVVVHVGGVGGVGRPHRGGLFPPHQMVEICAHKPLEVLPDRRAGLAHKLHGDLVLLAPHQVVERLGLLPPHDVVERLDLLAAHQVIEGLLGLLSAHQMVEGLLGLFASHQVVEGLGLFAAHEVIERLGLFTAHEMVEGGGLPLDAVVVRFFAPQREEVAPANERDCQGQFMWPESKQKCG